MWYTPMRLDKDGTPSLVQNIRYEYSMMYLHITFFNGQKARFDTDIAGDISLMQRDLTPMQYLQAENWLNNNIEIYWSELL